MSHHKRIEQYLDAVCSHVKCQEVHQDIRLELKTHIEEIIEQEQACGADQAEALNTALMCMGDPAPVGASLNKVHTPRVEWGLLALLAGFLGVAVLTMFSLTGFMGRNGEYLVHNTLIGAVPGAALAVGIFFVDYRRLVRFAPWVAGLVTLALTVLAGATGVFSHIRIFSAASPYLLAVAAGVILSRYKGTKPLDLAVSAAVVAVPTLFLMGVPAFTSAAVYLAAALVILLTLRWEQKPLIITSVAIVAILLAMFVVTLRPYQSARFMAFFRPHEDPHGAGYIPLRLLEAVSEGGAFGQRDLATYGSLPEPHTDFVFTYIVYRYGWVTALGLAMMAGLFIYRLAVACMAIREPVGRSVAVGLTATFTVMFAGSILVSLGKAPIMSFPFPFVSYSRVLLMAQIMAVGLVLGIYRVKDMISYTGDGVSEYKA